MNASSEKGFRMPLTSILSPQAGRGGRGDNDRLLRHNRACGARNSYDRACFRAGITDPAYNSLLAHDKRSTFLLCILTTSFSFPDQ